jgi:hypothetical protein
VAAGFGKSAEKITIYIFLKRCGDAMGDFKN